ncbi:response regulator transcription factor [Paenibacillus sanguinis]|uniref:response regulator transcription factor n=1 Tax=Paenibacillus sanguinis TaxID=225906 RepID=UPI00037A8CEE|nr:response regulator transcription factor [Paenibacillus sanguinis]
MNKILIVDDDVHFRRLVRTILEREGCTAYEANDGLEALGLLATVKADLVILDVMMPNMDGWELCQELRKHYSLPLLMLTAKGDIQQKVKGFQSGTDDYLVKPVEPMELVMRVKALLRRYQIVSSQTVSIGELFMDRKNYEITLGNSTLFLPLKEFELLFKLASQPNRTLSRDQLITEIWGYEFEGNERTLDVHINRLRQKFPASEHGFAIKTARGLGYCLEAPE